VAVQERQKTAAVCHTTRADKAARLLCLLTTCQDDAVANRLRHTPDLGLMWYARLACFLIPALPRKAKVSTRPDKGIGCCRVSAQPWCCVEKPCSETGRRGRRRRRSKYRLHTGQPHRPPTSSPQTPTSSPHHAAAYPPAGCITPETQKHHLCWPYPNNPIYQPIALTMPLVVPGLQSQDGNTSNEWMTKLLGKKLGDQHDEVVRTSLSFLLSLLSPQPVPPPPTRVAQPRSPHTTR